MNLRCVVIMLVLGFQSAHTWADTTISELPSEVPTTDGQITLFADYGQAKKSGTTEVYLINRSDHDITLEAQDGDVYLKLEARGGDGVWTRVQPHATSWCGNSYDLIQVKSGHFYKIHGYQPKGGKPAKIRYHLYAQGGLDLTTEAGEGVFSQDDASKAGSDALAVHSGSFEFVRDVATGAKPLVNTVDHIRDLQGYAISILGSGRFPKEKVLPVLDEIEKKFPDRKDAVNYVRKALQPK